MADIFVPRIVLKSAVFIHYLNLAPWSGSRTGTEVKLGSLSKMERFLDTLDHYLQARKGMAMC